MHSGPFVDALAGYIAIFVLVFVPALLIYLFWMIHILPEKIAERRGHPQLDAIKTLCLLSLVFGGLLWPIAWLWAYSKPVLHQLAYGYDRVPTPHDGGTPVEPAPAPAPVPEQAPAQPTVPDLAALSALPGKP